MSKTTDELRKRATAAGMTNIKDKTIQEIKEFLGEGNGKPDPNDMHIEISGSGIETPIKTTMKHLNEVADNLEKASELVKAGMKDGEIEKDLSKLYRKENFSYDYIFTPEELKDKSKQLANSCHDRNMLEDDKKQVMSGFKAKIDGKSAEINILISHIQTGREYITRTCDVEYDFDKGIKRFLYDGHKVGQEKLEQRDYQLQLGDRVGEEDNE